MQQIWFDVIRENIGWVVRCQQTQFGRYRTQSEAFDAAVAEARKIKDTKRLVHVRVLRENSKEDRYLSLV
jgi:flagellar basal body rod protein FlgC